ncbi:Di-sulfide bridge nucleocytoplasmic transport domain-containing protein [Annulohypoxylon truncatum]|uniref:Di-sulfide bridge nucleocytoplasmic transport domain-containing protein n=1 Tax=Annulohypoxylon truncatum TaxID=327061 RepID=UPI00200765BA|nr:Di-sulfide bridge nucleocytoplasmic transport domain-containing protein [Annulohypoxylon truncatum]KAI1212087.1 Di-sulfide bridge nucleocytoplasmic transport domain-containing protein [Annulohypoxylon truncatum]
MERRTFESPMEWEYQNQGPVDPSSPFAQSTKQMQANSVFGSNINNNNSFSRNPFQRTQSSTPSPSKPLPPTPNPSSIFSTSSFQRTNTAPPFRNPAFTTPRKPFDVDALSEVSAAESSPAGTDASELQDTPENDNSYDVAHMNMTPSTMNKYRSKKVSGKGELARTIFPLRDKVRKRKRYNADRDVSGYRVPYLQEDECDESDYESDESTFQPGKPRKDEKNRSKDGWFGSFLATVQRHPYAPSILGYWVTFAFNLFCVSGACWIGWAIISGLREDFSTERQSARADILANIDKCRADYIANKCHPLEKRLPGLHQICEDWQACMNQNPDYVKQVSNSAKEMAKILNDIVETMSYKTIALLILLFTIFIFSGRSLYKSTNAFTDIQPHPSAPFPSHHPGDQHHARPSSQVYWQAIPRTPHRSNSRHLLVNDDTPDTDEMPRFQALPPPETPMSRRRSPSKGERGRSPTKSRSPTKKY